MQRLAHAFRCAVRSLFSQASPPAHQTRRPGPTLLRLEALEDRLVPSVAHSAAGNLNGVAGTFTLANTGNLTFTPTASKVVTFVDSNVAEFNVDTVADAKGGPNLWELKTNGNLWELPGGMTAQWTLQDTNTGAMSLAPNGILSDLKMNGNLWRFKPGDPGGGFGAAPLSSGVTDASVDALGNIYDLRDGNVIKFSSATPVGAIGLNNNNAANPAFGAAKIGHVVSFQVGGNTVAFQFGYTDALTGEVFVSYDNGATFTALSSTAVGGEVTGSQYGVANDGTVFVRTDTSGAVNAGKVVQLSVTAKVTDTDLGTPITVSGNAATWFQLSPDGNYIAADAMSNLSVYSIGPTGAGVLGAEDVLESTGISASFGIANDDRVYELTTGAPNNLDQWTPSVNVFGVTDGNASGLAMVNASVGKWVLGANGQVAYLQGGFAPITYFWGNDNGLAQKQDSAPVVEIGVSRNGAQYELEASGTLWQWTGGNAFLGQSSPWNMLDTIASAFVVSTNSALYETESNGQLWRLSGDATTKPSMVNWTRLLDMVNVGGTPLYVLPDGTVVTLFNGGIEQITVDTSAQLSVGQNAIVWGNFAVAVGLVNNPGQKGFSPAFNPILVLGGQFSNIAGTGFTAFGPFLL
jgi:hypothetical protein